jgi:hypothetical protein
VRLYQWHRKDGKLKALVGEVVLIKGEITPKGTIYAHAVDPQLPPPKGRSTVGNEDEFPMPKGTSQTLRRLHMSL